jgi:hypothetical protein
LLAQLVVDPWDSLPFLLAASSIPILIRNYSRRRIDILDKLQVWCWSMVVVQVAFVGIHFYQPSRYYVAVIWPLALINSAYFYRLVTFSAEDRKERLVRAYRYMPLFIGIISFYISNSIPVIIIDLALIVFVIALSLIKRQKVAAVLMYSAIFVGLPMGTWGASYSNWTNSTGQTFFEALVDIGNRIPDNCIVMGRMAPFVALTHQCRVYVDPAALDGKNKSPDYVILNDGLEEIDRWEKKNGKVIDYLKYGWDESFKPLRYRIMGNYYSHKNTIVLKVKKSL